MLIERLHEHIIQELQQNSKSEMVFISMAVVLNLLTLGVNSGLASAPSTNVIYAILIVTMALVVVVNLVAWTGLRKGREAKLKLLNGLVRMYEEQNIAQYYDNSLLDAYSQRFSQYLIGVFATGIASLVIPVLILILK
ncbi:MAG: hypothetical protein V2A61_00650 [Calditrichota bacterium]